MRKSTIDLTAMFLYKQAIFDELNGRTESGICQKNLATWLNQNRKTIHRHIEQFEKDGLIEKTGSTNRNFDGATVSPYEWNTYKINSDKIEAFLKERNYTLPTPKEAFEEIGDFCKFSHEIRKEKKSAPEATTSELRENIIKKIETKKEKQRSKDEKLLKAHDEIFSVKKEIKELNEFFGATYKILYIDDLKKRCTSAFCSTPNPERGNQERIDQAKRILKAKEISHYDVKSSFCKISEGFGTGKIPSLKEDTYRAIIDQTELLDHKITDDEWQKIKPDLKMAAFMQTYMDENKITFRTHCQRERGYFHNGEYIHGYRLLYTNGTLKGHAKEVFEAEERLIDFFDKPLIDIIDEINRAMHRKFNLDKYFKSEIFLWESDLYILVQHALLTKHKIPTMTVYDCFYFDKKHEKTFNKVFEKVYRECFEKLLSDATVSEKIAEYQHIGEWEDTENAFSNKNGKTKQIKKLSEKTWSDDQAHIEKVKNALEALKRFESGEWDGRDENGEQMIF